MTPRRGSAPAAWRAFTAGQLVQCPYCGHGLGEVLPDTVVRVRRRGAPVEPPSLDQRCPDKECREHYELQTLPMRAAA